MQQEFRGKNVLLMLCSSCNMKCEHCYISYKGDMSIDNAKQKIEALGKKYTVWLNGAEPLVNLSYLELYPMVKQDFILTNGKALLVKENRDKLKYYGIKQINISYHFDIHDSISKISRQTVKNLIETLIKEGFTVKIMTTLSKINYKKLEEYCREAFCMGAKKIKFFNLTKLGNAENLQSNLFMSSEEIKEFLEQLQKVRNLYKKEDLEITRSGNFGSLTKITKNFNCYAGVDSVVITPDNKAYPCIFLISKEHEIGYYENDKIIITKPQNHNCSKCLLLNKI